MGRTDAQRLRRIPGPTGVSASVSNKTEGLDDLRAAVDAVSDKLGRRLKFLVGKPGLDGHSNGAEQIAVRARDCGMDITYDGIRLTPEEIVNAAIEQEAHVVGLSILSGSHVPLVEDLMERMRNAGLGHIPVIVGGIIPDEDAKRLKGFGVARVYTPKDFELNTIMKDIVTLVDPKRLPLNSVNYPGCGNSDPFSQLGECAPNCRCLPNAYLCAMQYCTHLERHSNEY